MLQLITGAIKNINTAKESHQLSNVVKRWATAKYFSESYTFEWLTSLESKFPEQPRQPIEETENVAAVPFSSMNNNKRNKSIESNSSMMKTVILAMRKMLYGIFQAFENSTTSTTEKVNYRVMIMTAFLLLRNLEDDVEASDNHPALVMACFYLAGKVNKHFSGFYRNTFSLKLVVFIIRRSLILSRQNVFVKLVKIVFV